VKFAVQRRLVVIVTELPQPLSPVQPVNLEPVVAVAVRAITLPLAYDSEQSEPQLIPVGALTTVPLPVPALVTVRAYVVVVAAVNAAFTDIVPLTLTVHGPVPVQPPPLQPVKDEPAAGAAVSVTDVPAVTDSVQSEPQLMPAGLLTTVPVPVPDLVAVSVYEEVGGGDCGAGENIAEMLTGAFPVVMHGLVPVQPPPLQPANTDPVAAVGVRVTTLPAAKLSKQSEPQVMPVGLLTTVPDPVPVLATVTSNVPPVVRHASFE
jgi:hypothetical protein